ncbi:FBD-associated F-box protein At3g49020-like isoform X2 [Raphanus sativus]|uniref:FBD-associated F-box protein At3g49020-like isoform X2 n=1 Tax=Raphanus sativus TaxID=3726 RepID=A0A9W3DIK8_RAPSA|nr:FBD-associated F-box protein At3g49020-like isoform X2 [Raphanus sativus]
MKQKRKIGGESLKNRDAMNEDRISELPEPLLLQILSSVPTKDAIATSVLSKRWRSLWKMVPKLDFGFNNKQASSEDVYRLLILHKPPVLESLHLLIRDRNGRFDIGILIAVAFTRHVRELVLDHYNEDEDEKTVEFPSVLCSYNNTLEVLKLKHHVLLGFPSRVCFSALRELHLCHVVFESEASVCNLLSGCPRLQDLVVLRHSNFDVLTYTIDVPSLQRLTIEEDSSQDMYGGGYVINAPSLKYLNIKGLCLIDIFLMEKAPELVEAKIEGLSDIANDNILASLTSAKRLSLHFPLKIKYPTGSIFHQLVSLKLHINRIIGWNLLSFMLDSSPKLQILKLTGTVRWGGNGISRNVCQNVCCSIWRHWCGEATDGNENMRNKWPHTSSRTLDS